MPKLKLPDGKVLKYKTVPLFPGVKMIDKQVATENLSLLKVLLNEYGIEFQLHAGTLLGAVREHDFISHDEDIDLALLDSDREKFLSKLPDLEAHGFKVCRYDRRDLISVMRKGEYIDFYFYKPYSKEFLSCSGWLVKRNHIEESSTIIFKDKKYNVPKCWEEYLVAEYGPTWGTHLKWNNYEIPTIKRFIFEMKEYLKDYLPSFLFRYLSNRAEQRLINRSKLRIKRNLGILIEN